MIPIPFPKSPSRSFSSPSASLRGRIPVHLAPNGAVPTRIPKYGYKLPSPVMTLLKDYLKFGSPENFLEKKIESVVVTLLVGCVKPILLNNKSFWAFSLGSKSSNWSAPMVEMLGLVPPVPATIMYRPEKNTPACKSRNFVTSLSDAYPSLYW